MTVAVHRLKAPTQTLGPRHAQSAPVHWLGRLTQCTDWSWAWSVTQARPPSHCPQLPTLAHSAVGTQGP